jgi:hypothetical protein
MRTGVLSDLAIKSAYPEYQPLNIGLSQAVESVVFDKHELVGVRLPKNYNPKRVPRFPINDLNNFSTLSSAPNKSKQVYTSIQGYRKKLGSSNVDTEVRQNMRPRITAANEPVAFMSNNFELKMRGGVVDRIKDNAVSQADIYANTKQVPHNKIIEANKSIRTEGAKMASVERRINIENLDNFTNATKTAQEKRETDYGNYLTSEFVRTNGGELYYNYLTIRDYHHARNPNKHHEGYGSKQMTLTYNIDLRRKDDMTSKELMDYDPTNAYLQQMKREATQTRDQLTKEGEAIAPMTNEDTEITATEEYSSKTEKPFVVSKNEKPMKQEDVDKMEAQMTIDPNEPVLSKSKASQNDPKRIPDNLAEFIKQKEQAKMQDPAYQQETDDYLTDRSKITQQKRIDKVELTPTKYKEKYGVDSADKNKDYDRQMEHKKMMKTKDFSSLGESSGLGQQLRNKRGDIAQHYKDYYQKEIAPTLTHREAMASYYVAERERVYDEREQYDAMYDEAFGTNPF